MNFLFVLTLLSCFGGAYLQNQVKPEEFAVAILDRTDKPICAGAFVHKQYVVTTAKCVYMKTGLKVAIESANTNDDNKKRPVTMTYIHPYYSALMLDYNVAVLRVDTVNHDRNIKELNLPDAEVGKVNYLYTAGWDPTKADQKYENGVSNLVDRQKCTKDLEKNVTVTRKLICLDNSNVVLPFVEGSPANTLKDDEHIKNLVGIATMNFKGFPLPTLFINTAHPEIAIFIKSIVP